MYPFRVYLLRLVVISALFLTPSRSYGQWPIDNASLAEFLSKSIIDTSDYLPYTYSHALDLNLMIAASKGYVIEIERLISKGADVDAATLEGATPLVFAIENNRIDAVNALLKHNPELDLSTANDETPLMMAVKMRNFEITESLLRAGSDIEYTDRYGATCLHYAAVNGYLEMVDLLLYYDAYTDAMSRDGTTPLLAAVYAGNAAEADLLIQNSANLELADDMGFTPFLLAAFYGDTLIMDILIKKGADIYAKTNNRHNALTLSIMSGDTATTSFLLSKGNKWTEKGNNFLDPYKVASKYRRQDAIDILNRNNIPGLVDYEIDQMGFTISSKFNFRDIYTGFSLSFKEPYLNLGFITGLDMKLWDTRVFIKESENLYYQYHHKSYLAYAGIFKDFSFTDTPGKWNTSFSASLLAGYSFANTLKGTSNVPEDKFKLIPSASFKFTKLNYTINTGFEYLKTPFYENGPIWFRICFTYNYFFDDIRMKAKQIKWY